MLAVRVAGLYAEVFNIIVVSADLNGYKVVSPDVLEWPTPRYLANAREVRYYPVVYWLSPATKRRKHSQVIWRDYFNVMVA